LSYVGCRDQLCRDGCNGVGGVLENMTSMDEGDKSYGTIVLIVKSDIIN